jgi:Ca2+-binding RTX toxin-like protein
MTFTGNLGVDRSISTTLLAVRSEEVSRRRTLRLLTALIALSSVCLLAAGAAGAATVKVVRSLETVQPGASPTGLAVDNPQNGTPTAHLRAARDEFESFQIVVRNDAVGALGNLEVETAGALTGPGGATIPAADITIYREGYYTVYTPSDQEGWEQYNVLPDEEGFNTTWKCSEATVGPTFPLPCEYPDALIPKKDVFYGEARNAFPTSVPAGQNRVAWIDVLVPSGTPTGEYSGHLLVSANGLSQTVGVDVNVFDFEVPPTPTLQGGWDMTPHRPCAPRGGCAPEEGFELDSLYDRAALENRIGITHPSYEDPTGNPATAGSNAALFRRYVLPLLQGTSPQDPGGNLSPVRLPGAEIKELFINQFSAADAGAWKSEAEHGGFLGRLRFYCDEMGESLTKWQNECNKPWETASAGWGGGLKTVFTGNLAALEFAHAHDFAVADSIDTLIPLVDQMHPRNGTNQRGSYEGFAGTAGNRLWLYQTCDSLGCSGGYTPPNDYSAASFWDGWPSLGIDQPASEARAMDWQVFNYKAAGQFYYEVASQLPVAWADCSQGEHICQYVNGGNGDGTLFYPGTAATIGGAREIPVESIRMKRYRDGEEDYELLHYLATELGKESQVREIAGGPYAPAAETGLFKRMNLSNVSDVELETARDALIGLLPGSTDHAPVLGAIGDKVVAAGQRLAFTLSATDQDGDALTYSASGLPPGAGFDPISREFEWTPGLAAVGTHSGVRFSVSDGQEGDAEEISISVGGSGETCDGKAVTIPGGPEADHLVGTAGPDVISGGAGDDTIEGGGGDDTICGGDGYDTIEGGLGNDTLEGGAGEDAVEYGRTTGGGVVVDLRKERDQATGAAGTDQLSGFSEVYGSPGDDTLIGSDSNLPGPHGWSEYLAGNGGDDTIVGGGGPDLLNGGDGGDTIEGGPGEDQIQGGAGADRIEVRDGTFDTVSCGGDLDSVTADAIDAVEADCEAVDRGAATDSQSSPGPAPTPTPSPSPLRLLPDTAFGHTPKHQLEVRSLPAKVTLSFRSTPGVHFSCRLDARYYARCSSPFVARVGVGHHYFSVTASDEAGTDPSPAAWAFTVKRPPANARRGSRTE